MDSTWWHLQYSFSVEFSCYFVEVVGEARSQGQNLAKSDEVAEALIIPDKDDMFIGFATVPEYV